MAKYEWTSVMTAQDGSEWVTRREAESGLDYEASVIERLRAENAEMRKDRERLDWLDSDQVQMGVGHFLGSCEMCPVPPGEARENIDAAMRSKSDASAKRVMEG